MVGAPLPAGQEPQFLRLTGKRLSLAGGSILFLIAIRTEFPAFGDTAAGPVRNRISCRWPQLICGPGLPAIIVTVPEKSIESLTALPPAWLVQAGILLLDGKNPADAKAAIDPAKMLTERF